MLNIIITEFSVNVRFLSPLRRKIIMLEAQDGYEATKLYCLKLKCGCAGNQGNRRSFLFPTVVHFNTSGRQKRKGDGLTS